jgi:HEAT repeat protein
MARFWLSLALMAPILCHGQITGTFSLEKSTFAYGEPVFLSLTLHNDGSEAEEIGISDPYSCSGYQIYISRDAAPAPTCFKGGGWGVTCLSGALSLVPGASHAERILLNYKNVSHGDLRAPVGPPGDYTVDASRDIAFALPGNSAVFSAPDHIEVSQQFHIRVDDSLELSPAAYAPYVQQLSSKDDQVRSEAARTLATLAPAALESLLLTFATSKDHTVKQFAPLALANLGTKKSLAALAQMLVDNEPGTYESMTAADNLGKTHDPAWYPVLLEFADQRGSMYLSYAAESGGDIAIPALVARMHNLDLNTRGAAIYALGQTGSRSAVPILISLLGVEGGQREQAGLNDAISANAALRQLTHFYAEQGSDGDLISTWQRRWQHWWSTSGSTANIYRPGECVADMELP